ncbi:hypothetical protein [Romboutsia ilealis]|uniref:hypothetical protein n=1 Tax=Romboutsia ilealis TaxID=1115758 RepID=UPI00289CD9DA|nr:hypothetical protein [Romboutsia ilealis]
MQKIYNNRSIEKIFNTIKELVDASSNKEKVSVDLEITTTDGYTNKIQINKENEKNLAIKKNLIMNDNVAISMDNITKIKILNNNDNPNFKKLLIQEIKDSTIDEENNYRYDSNIGYSRAFLNKSKDKNIEDYIRRNYKNIKNINYNAIKNDNKISSIENITSEEVLKHNTDLDVNTKKSLKNIELEKSEKSVVENITSEKKNIVKDIKIEKKKVLTTNCEDVEVSKPIKTNKIGVLSDINTQNYNVVINQSKTKVVKELNQNKLTSVRDIESTYVNNVIKDIDINEQIIKPETVELLIIGPMNKYLNKEEIQNRPLRVDPTGEGYIGVVLDDGTFEPIKASIETFTIIPSEAKNILANIEGENISNRVVSDINIEKDEFVNSIDVDYDNNVLTHKKEDIKPLKDILKTSNAIVNNIINENDTISVVTKQGSEYINNIKDIKHDTVSNILGVETVEVVKSIDISKDYGEFVEKVKLNKDSVNVVNDIDVKEEKVASCINEKIKGNLEFVRNGIMLVEDDGELTIYSTNKISSINQ